MPVPPVVCWSFDYFFWALVPHLPLLCSVLHGAGPYRLGSVFHVSWLLAGFCQREALMADWNMGGNEKPCISFSVSLSVCLSLSASGMGSGPFAAASSEPQLSGDSSIHFHLADPFLILALTLWPFSKNGSSFLLLPLLSCLTLVFCFSVFPSAT